jgi:hypothetical protein
LIFFASILPQFQVLGIPVSKYRAKTNKLADQMVNWIGIYQIGKLAQHIETWYPIALPT